MRQVDPKIYDKNFYLTECLGSEEFTKSNGKKLHLRVKKMLEGLKITKNMTVLDIGCGRGDITLFLAKDAKVCVGIDYSKDAIEIAKDAAKKFPKSIREKVNFKVMDAKKLDFPDNYFDLIINIDVLEHLYKEEADLSIKEIKRVLKKDGILFLRTVTNKTLYDLTYIYYIRPMNLLLTAIDKKIKKVDYNSFPKDPRIPTEKIQHVNEPTFFYLFNLFKKYKFEGNIKIEIGYIKEVKNFKTKIYNFLIALYPVSKLFPLNLFFGWAFLCTMRNKK